MTSFIKKALPGFATVVTLTVPQIASAQTTPFGNVIDSVQDIINSLLPVISALALLAFFYGLTLYVFQADDEDAQERGKQTMIAGIVALVLMAAIGGIVNYIETQVLGSQSETIDVENPINSP